MQWAWLFFWSLLGFCGFLTTLTSLYLLRRTRRHRARLRTAAECRARIVNLMGEFAFGDEAPSPHVDVHPRKRNVFQAELVKQIVNLKGQERDFLLSVYDRMGFLREDLESLRSPDWSHRLRAVARLEYLEVKGIAREARELLADPHPLVALGAARILSRLDASVGVEMVASALERGGYARKDGWIDVLQELCRQNEASFLKCVTTWRLGNATSLGVAVLGHRKAIASVGPLVRMLDPLVPQPGAETVLREGALAFGRIGDPRAVPLLLKLLDHHEPRVRAAAVWALSVTDPEALVPKLVQLSGDPSLQVRRAVFHARRHEAL